MTNAVLHDDVKGQHMVVSIKDLRRKRIADRTAWAEEEKYAAAAAGTGDASAKALQKAIDKEKMFKRNLDAESKALQDLRKR